jgi:hypothetical protein
VNTEEHELDRIAAECLAEAGGDWEKAARHTRKIIDEDQGELRETLINRAVWDLVRHAESRARASLVGKTPQNPDDTSGLHAMAKERKAQVSKSLLDFALPGGKRLRYATRPELTEAADWYLALGRTCGLRGRWIQHIAGAMPDDEKRVEDVISDAQAKTLYEASEREA